jgi:hypothetical protein
MILNEKASINTSRDKFTSSYTIQVYSNEHGKGHMEVLAGNVKYFVYIPTVEEWRNNKTFEVLITSTKPNIITKPVLKELIKWADLISNKNPSYTNIEYSRFFWNTKNIENIHKNLILFEKIKDISPITNTNQDIRNIGDISIIIIKDKPNYLEFIYDDISFHLINNVVGAYDPDGYDLVYFLQQEFDK